jgi:hypothetical protein
VLVLSQMVELRWIFETASSHKLDGRSTTVGEISFLSVVHFFVSCSCVQICGTNTELSYGANHLQSLVMCWSKRRDEPLTLSYY